MTSSENNNNLQFDIILNNEAMMLESFIQFFCMAGMHFSEFSIFSKSN
jgi:hypothetical protein